MTEATHFRIYVRDRPNSSFSMPLVGEIDAYTSFEAEVRHLDVGAWTMKIPAGTEQANLIRPGRGIVVFLADDPSEPVFTGPIRTLKLTKSKDAPGKGVLTVSGPCDNVIFNERVGRGTPRFPTDMEGFGGVNRDPPAAPPQIKWSPVVYDGADRYPLNSGEFIWGLVHENYAISQPYSDSVVTSDVSRRIKYFDVPRQVPAAVKALPADTVWRGFPVSMSTIGETVFALADVVGYTVRCMWLPADGKLHLTIARPVDRSATAVFGEASGNLLGYEFTLQAPEATRLFMAGATPNEADRRYYQDAKNDLFDPAGWKDYDTGGSSSTWNDPGWGRQSIEVEWNTTAEAVVDVRNSEFKYASDPTYLGLAMEPTAGSLEAARFLQQRRVSLADKGPKGAFTLDAADIEGCRFGIDYFVGDKVRALLDTTYIPAAVLDADGVLRDYVTTVRISSSASEMWRVEPTIGTADSVTPWIYRTLRKMKRQLDVINIRT